MISLPKLSTELRHQLESKTNIVGLSGGKDSVATCILLYYLGIPFQTVTAEIVFLTFTEDCRERMLDDVIVHKHS